MKMDKLKALPVWAKVAAVLAAAYIAFFQIPTIWMTGEWLWQCIRQASVAGIAAGLLAVLLAVAHLVVWMLSSYLSALAYHVTKKKAYAFLLAYFLLSTITAPVSFLAQKTARIRRHNQVSQMSAEQQEQAMRLPVRQPQVAYVKRDLSIPAGPILLLLAIWFMCKAEGIRLTNKPSAPSQ
jgi:hypothetical protein